MIRLVVVAVLLSPLGCKKDEPAAKAPPVVYGPVARKEKAVNLPAPGTPPPATNAPASFGSIWEVPLHTLSGKPTTLAEHKGKAILVVNVASQCGLTPQYAALEAVQEKYASRGFTVLGFPCNQFGGQEPGTAEEIQTFCSTNYGITFPILEKIEVNGPGRNAVYQQLTPIADASGHQGDIRWNFEKFLIAADGTHVTRFSPKVTPDDPALLGAIEASLPRR